MSAQRSIQEPQAYLVRNQFRFADPTGLMPEQWRLVAREPVNAMAIRFIVRELVALDWAIESNEKDDPRTDDLKERWDDLFLDDSFDVWMSLVLEDLCTLPFGGASEVGRTDGELSWVVHVDAGTLMPTYETRTPYVQVNPDDWSQKVWFTKEQLYRVRVAPRSDIRFKQYQRSPTEEAYLAIEALSRIYVYYMQQLTDTPPPGILDLMDMRKDDALEWATNFRELVGGIDAIKVPVLYAHTIPAKFIPFGPSPQDLNVVEQFKRFAELLLGKYGLSIGDLRLFEHDATKAGQRVSQLVTERSGVGFWAALMAKYITRMLPKGLAFKFRQPRPEKELVVAQRQQTQVAFLQALTGGKPIITQDDALEQLSEWEVLTVEAEVPEPEPIPPALAANAGQEGPTQEEMDADEETRDQFDDADLAKSVALLVKAELGEWQEPGETTSGGFTKAFVGYFKAIGEGINEDNVGKALEVARLLLVPSEEKADLGDIDAAIEEVLDGSAWWKLPPTVQEDLRSLFEDLYLHGLNVGAGQILFARGEATSPYATLSWNVKNPRVVELIEAQGAELVTNVDSGTKYFLRQVIKEAVEKGYSQAETVDGIMYDLLGLPSGEASKFTRERVMSITNYETNQAMSRAGSELRDQLGLQQKQWFANGVEPCEICLGNAAAGIVEKSFEYGGVFGPIMYPPAHPHTCHCVVTASLAEVRALEGPIDWPMQLKAYVDVRPDNGRIALPAPAPA